MSDMKLIMRKAALLHPDPAHPHAKEVVRNVTLIGTDAALSREFDVNNDIVFTYLLTKNSQGQELVRIIDPEQRSVLDNATLKELTASVGEIKYHIDVKEGILSFTSHWIALRGQEIGPSPTILPWVAFTTDFVGPRTEL